MTMWFGRLKFWAILGIWLALSGATQARTVLELDAARQPVKLLDWGDYWLDPSGRVPLIEVALSSELEWKPTSERLVHPLGPGKTLWIRFIVPPAPDGERWYLEVPYGSVDRVSLYTLDSADNWNEQRAGDSVAVSRWPVPHRHPLLPVAVSAEEPARFLVRIENAHNFSAPLSFVSESFLYRSEQRVSLILGIYFGLAGLAVMLSLLSAVSLRDTAYGVYALSVGLMALTQASITGIAGLHLWPDLPRWNDASAFILPLLALASLLWFSSAVVSLSDRSRTLHRLLISMASLGVLAALLTLIIDPAERPRLVLMYVLVAMFTGVTAVLWAWRRGDRFGLWLVAGNAPVILAAAFPMARLAGWIPVSFMTQHGMQIGIAIELPVLLVILMVRSAQRREHNRRVQGLDRMDPATGLMNNYVFAEELLRMMARAQRLKHSSTVLLIDITNFDQIERDFDRRSAEELPLRVAGRLLSAAREIDAVARLSERRFGMLIEGPLTPEEAAQAGPRVVARGLMPFKDKPLSWVAQLRVAQAMIPQDGTDVQQLVARLDALLAQVPPDSKRAVYSLPEEGKTA